MAIKFTDNSESAKNGLLEQEKQALRKCAKLIRDAAKELVPVRTGALKKSISTWVRVQRKTGDVHLELGVYDKDRAQKKGLFYRGSIAHMIEFGTRKMNAQPFLKPAVYNNIDEIKRIQAEFLPDIQNVPTLTETDEEVEG